MFILTDFGKKEIKPKRVFKYKEYLFVIAELPVKYGSTTERIMTLLNCVHYYTGRRIPINFKTEKNIKSYIETSILKLASIEKTVGEEEFNKELSKHEKINIKISAQWKIN